MNKENYRKEREKMEKRYKYGTYFLISLILLIGTGFYILLS